jgi:uncharacterized protein
MIQVRVVRHAGTLRMDECSGCPIYGCSQESDGDRDPRPGSFLLTGSTRLLDLASLPDAPGRSGDPRPEAV